MKMKIDWENSCEECWDLFSELMLMAGFPDPRHQQEPDDVPKEIWEALKKCPHNPPIFAPSILLLAEEVSPPAEGERPTEKLFIVKLWQRDVELFSTLEAARLFIDLHAKRYGGVQWTNAKD